MLRNIMHANNQTVKKQHFFYIFFLLLLVSPFNCLMKVECILRFVFVFIVIYLTF